MSHRHNHRVHRTTIRLDEELLTHTKEYAARYRMSVTAVIEEALRAKIFQKPPARSAKRARIKIPTYGKGGTRPGVNLDDREQMWDLAGWP